MANSLIACGGTGAHAALAMMRLHTLGYELGFFEFNFPTLYLVDQDAGDGEREETAGQMVRRLVNDHPSRTFGQAPNSRIVTPPRIVTPLPIGHDDQWYAFPNNTLGNRFAQSPYLDLLTNQDQREIQFSQGMMGSPSVGALLFRLKNHDVMETGINHDRVFTTLRQEQGRIAVVGSGVGGTGAAVVPTLARQFAASGAEVMAVMVLQWFKFTADGLDENLRERAELRNNAMRQNANSALAYCGQDLAREVTTVPVGVPETAIIDRRYTSDTQQPAHESFVHGVAALCCLRHFLASEPYLPGLYQMGAEDPTRLGGGNLIPGSEYGTLQDLANQAETLAFTLDTFATVLTESHSGIVPAIYREIQRLTDPGQASQAIKTLVENYQKHLEWMQKVLGVKPRSVSALTTEAMSRERLTKHSIKDSIEDSTQIPPNLNMPNVTPEQVARGLFRWVAKWIRDYRETRPIDLVSGMPSQVNGGYWPPLSGDGIAVAAEQAGDLTRVPDQNIEVTLDGFVNTEEVSQNGWPDPIAVADHFRYAIQRGDRTALRQLEMLLVGLVTGHLELQEIPNPREPEPVSLAALVNASRETRFPDLARYRIIYPERENEVLGFNSPHTLLCAKPPSGQSFARIWGSLWQELTKSEQPDNWATADWDHDDRQICQRPIRQIRSWLGHLQERHPGTPPAWMRIFDDQLETAPIEYGVDKRTWSVYWTDQLVPVELPTGETGNYVPPQGTPQVPEDEMLNQIPKLRELQDGDGHTLFKMVTFEVPDREHLVRAIWKEHLDHLQKDGLIYSYGSDDENVFIRMPDGVRAGRLRGTRILDRSVMMVKSCSPMQQVPVPGSTTQDNAIRYPDLPLHLEYLGLVETETNDGRIVPVLNLLKDGDSLNLDLGEFEPAIDDRRVTWTLRMKGRRDPLPISLPPPDGSEYHKAHWMVWPRFRSNGDEQSWRAYYIYERCSDTRLRLETLWLDPDSIRVHRGGVQDEFGSHPVRFDTTDDRRVHTGGPPVAFSVRNKESEEEIGLYLIQLTPLALNDADLNIGIDFGTSHTVASILEGDKRSVVELAPELADAQTALTLYVSENQSHVEASYKEGGLLALGGWLPNYVRDVARDATGLLPSELLTIRPLINLNTDNVAEWQPGRDCVIPLMDMQRQDIANHILADFKWDVSIPEFKSQVNILRKIYLGMVIELVMADVVWSRRTLPRRANFTFTYPLRTQPQELGNFGDTLRNVLDNSRRSLGCNLTLRDNTGIYNESRAAKGGTGNFGEVCLVGDLGGGTLDLFISANALPSVEFEEVADSAKLGGNLLLQNLANAKKFLPHGWGKSPKERETQLRAWMRSQGSPNLFGRGAGQRIRHEGLGVQSFDKESQANPARLLISRYFRLISEYMARSLVAFLACHWYKQAPQIHHDRLQVLVQLRGNGWRLWHDADNYRQIEELIGEWIKERACVLWEDPGLWSDWSDQTIIPQPPNNWTRGGGNENPKTAPILAAVGKAEANDEANQFYSHTLVKLHLVHVEDSLDPIPWFSRNRFETGSRQTQVELREINPPLPLSHPDEKGAVVKTIENFQDVNNKLRTEGGYPNEVDFQAPVAPIVWEAAFESLDDKTNNND